MVSRVVLYLVIGIIYLNFSIEALSNRTTWLTDRTRIHKEGPTFLPSIRHMKVTVKTDVGFFFLGPQIQFLKTKIDLEEMPMGLDDSCWP